MRVTSLEAPIDQTSTKEPKTLSKTPRSSQKEILEVDEEIEPLNFETSSLTIQEVTKDLAREFAEQSQGDEEETEKEEPILLRSLRKR